MLEKQIQKNIITYLKSLPHCTAENVPGNAFASGRPDINACWHGYMLRIEVKTPDHGNKASVVQEENLWQWAAAGCTAIVVDCLQDVKDIVDHKHFRCITEGACSLCPIREKNNCYEWKERQL